MNQLEALLTICIIVLHFNDNCCKIQIPCNNNYRVELLNIHNNQNKFTAVYEAITT